MLAAKTSLAARVDALGEDADTAMGIENRAKLEMRLKSLEENQVWISTWVCRFISLSFKVWKAKNSDAIDWCSSVTCLQAFKWREFVRENWLVINRFSSYSFSMAYLGRSKLMR